ncbi:hypothetical protein HY468_01390 [Candidatus Roizmanbacteria bacterium]|nr:hypothetical protein [Candidatus Roizmanbacteria bacterium]
MRKILTFLKNDRTLKSTTVMVGGHNLANVGAYLYHLFMGRMLVPSDYGALQSLISLSNILNVPLVTINTVVMKFVSTYVGRGEPEKISSLYYQLKKIFLVVLGIGGLIFLLLTGPILQFLHLTSWLLVLFLDVALFFGLVNFLNRATLQGLAKFVPLTIAQTIETFGKLMLGIIAVSIGWGVAGAYGAFVLIMFVSYAYMTRILKIALGKPTWHPLPLGAMGKFAIPSALMTVGVTALYNTDVVLVRHFLSAYEAGLYAALSVLGKIIFFGTAPITSTMFPLVSEAHARGERHRGIFLKSLLFLVAIAGSVTLVFSLAPDILMSTLIGSQYTEAAAYLSRFSIFLSLVALIFLFLNYFLSIQRMTPIYVVLVGSIAQAVLLFLYHTTITTVITISLSVTTILSVMLSLYFLYVSRS